MSPLVFYSVIPKCDSPFAIYVLIKDTTNYLQSIISHSFPVFSAYFITDNVPFDFPSQKAMILSA